MEYFGGIDGLNDSGFDFSSKKEKSNKKNKNAVKDYIINSETPMKSAKEITENILAINKANIFGNVSADSMTPFDSLVSLSSDNKAIQERAKYLQGITRSGKLSQEDADKEASKLTDLYVRM